LSVLVVSLVGTALWKAQRGADPAPETPKPKLTLATLATTPFSYEPIDAPGMLGDFTSFDPIANYEWARSIGRAWKADAVLYRLDVDKVAKDGTVDVKNVPRAEAMYRFYSPACLKERNASTSVVVPTTKCGLYVQVQMEDGGPTALVNSVDGDSSSPAQLASPVCTLSKALSALASAGKLPQRPVYDVSLFVSSVRAHGASAEWVISDIQNLTTGSVDATSCAVR
jgi:hypothetical protein